MKEELEDQDLVKKHTGSPSSRVFNAVVKYFKDKKAEKMEKQSRQHPREGANGSEIDPGCLKKSRIILRHG